MRKIIAFILKKMGWKITLQLNIPAKCVICVAPHTSNWDFITAISLYKSIGGNPRFLMKKDWFFFPFGNIFRAMGGIPVDRSKKTSLTQQMVDLFAQEDHLQLAVSPEGTRKRTSHWRTGFYYIAIAAKVPIILAYLDYGKKDVGVERIFLPTGNVEEDIQKIKNYYKDIQPKYPDKFSI